MYKDLLRSDPRRSSLVEPLISRIECRDGDIDDTHLAVCTVATSRVNECGGKGLDRDLDAIEFQVPLALQDQIDLSHSLVLNIVLGSTEHWALV